MTKKNKKSKKYPLWFEDPYERIRKTEEEFHKLMSDFWKDPFEFKFTFPKMEFDIKGIKPIPVTISNLPFPSRSSLTSILVSLVSRLMVAVLAFITH